MLATGATHSYFGHDEWAEVAPGLKRIEDATRIRRRILIAFERAEITRDEAERKRLLTFVIVGGGADRRRDGRRHRRDRAPDAWRRDFRRIDPRTVAHRPDRSRAAHHAGLAGGSVGLCAAHACTRMGVEVMTATRVTDCDAGGVDLEGGRIDCRHDDLGGRRRASPAARWLDAEHDRPGACRSVPTCRCRAIRRFSRSATPQRSVNGQPIPGIAPAAKQMGRYVGRLIAARLAGKPVAAVPLPSRRRSRHHRPQCRGGEFGRLELTGLPRLAVLERGAHLFPDRMRERFMVAFMWLWDYLTFQRGARLITDVPSQAAGKTTSKPS